jgi:hypothetical protein
MPLALDHVIELIELRLAGGSGGDVVPSLRSCSFCLICLFPGDGGANFHVLYVHGRHALQLNTSMRPR